MKKIILLLLLVSSFANAQIKSFDEDLRLKYESFKKMSVKTEEMKAIKLQAIESMAKYATDLALQTEINTYLQDFKRSPLDIDNIKSFDLSKIPQDKLSNFRSQTNKFSSNTFFNHKKVRGAHIYVGLNSNGSFLRFKASSNGSSWIFFKKIQFLIDGVKYEYIPNDLKRDVSSGSRTVNTKESFDNLVTEVDMPLIRAISNAKEPIDVRYLGDYYRDGIISKNNILVFKETLDLYNYFKTIE